MIEYFIDRVCSVGRNRVLSFWPEGSALFLLILGFFIRCIEVLKFFLQFFADLW